MSDSRIDLVKDGEIARVSIDRPEEGNLMSAAMIAELTRLLNEAAAIPPLKAVVLTGTGNDFCVGREPGAGGGSRTALEMREGLTGPILGLYAAVRGAEIPVVASVQGRAAGFGLCYGRRMRHNDRGRRCTVQPARDDSRPAAHARHVRAYRPHHAEGDRVLVYSTGTVDADTARTLGFVSNVVPAAALRDETEALLATLTARRRDALITCKQFLSNARLMETDRPPTTPATCSP